MSATNSLPYCVAHVLAHGNVKVALFFPPAGDVRVQAIVNQIEIAYRSDMSATRVELHRSDGSVDVIVSHKESSCRFADLVVEDVERKFRLCLAESDWSMSKSADRILRKISRLEELDDIRTLFL